MNKQEEIVLDFFLLHNNHDADNWLGSGKSLNDAYHHLINGGFGDIEYITTSEKDYHTKKWSSFNNLVVKIDKSKSKSGNEEKLQIKELDINRLKLNKYKYPILFGTIEISEYAFCKTHLITDLKDEFHINNGVYAATPEYIDYLIENKILINDLDKNNPRYQTKILSGV